MGRIFLTKKEKETCIQGDCQMENIKSKFLEVLIESLLIKLKLNYREGSEIIKNLLKTSLEREVNDLLEDFLHHQLTIIVDKTNKNLNLNSEINYNYATHAKLDNFLKDIFEKGKKEIKNE